MQVYEKYRLLLAKPYGNFRQNDEVIVTNVLEFPAAKKIFYTIQNVKDSTQIATYEFINYHDLVLLN